MAKFSGDFDLSANFNINKAAPVDTRTVVDSVADLTTSSVWENSDGDIFVYDGLTTAVKGDGVYMLSNSTAAPANWVWTKIGGDAAMSLVDLDEV